MKFKHAFHVLVDNFATTYKLLIYKIFVLAVTIGLMCAVLIPTFNMIANTPEYSQLHAKFTEIWSSFSAISTENNESTIEGIKNFINTIQNTYTNFKEFIKMVIERTEIIVTVMLCMTCVHFINRFLTGIGNYTAGTLVNDRMSLHAKSSFTGSLIKNLGSSCLYSIIYAPLALLYDMIGFSVVGALLFKIPNKVVPLVLKIFISAVAILLLYALKFTLTTNWLPSLINGKKNNRKAMAYSFNLKGKQAGGVFSTAIVMMVIIMALNVAAILFTFGAGLLITIPATSMMLLSLQFVNYFDSTQLKYFVDDYTVIGPKKEAPVSRENFFKGED